jgi:hypothetical protein
VDRVTVECSEIVSVMVLKSDSVIVSLVVSVAIGSLRVEMLVSVVVE